MSVQNPQNESTWISIQYFLLSYFLYQKHIVWKYSYFVCKCALAYIIKKIIVTLRPGNREWQNKTKIELQITIIIIINVNGGKPLRWSTRIS